MCSYAASCGRRQRAACHVAGGRCRRPCTSPHFLLFLFARLILLLATVHSSPIEEFRFVAIADVKVSVVFIYFFIRLLLYLVLFLCFIIATRR